MYENNTLHTEEVSSHEGFLDTKYFVEGLRVKEVVDGGCNKRCRVYIGLEFNAFSHAFRCFSGVRFS